MKLPSALLNLLKLVVALALLYFLYTRLADPARLWRQFVEADKLLLLAGATCYSAAVALSAIKWGVLLQSSGIHVPRARLLAYQWVAEFFNNFLPAQVGGDVMRGYALAAETRRTASAAASVLIDRFLGLLVFMLGAALASWAMLLFGRPDGNPFTPEQTVSVRLIALGSGLVTLALLMALTALLSRRLKAWAEAILARLPLAHVLVPIWQKVAEAFNAYRHQYRAMLFVVIASAVIVVLTSVNIWLIARAIEPNRISMIEVLAINPIIVFVALIIPLSPGGLGVRQGAFAATFYLVGAGEELGLLVGLLQQVIAYAVSLPGGYLWLRGNRPRPTPAASEEENPSLQVAGKC